MIHDKDYIIRIVKQFSEFLAMKLLEKMKANCRKSNSVFLKPI